MQTMGKPYLALVSDRKGTCQGEAQTLSLAGRSELVDTKHYGLGDSQSSISTIETALVDTPFEDSRLVLEDSSYCVFTELPQVRQF